MSTEQSMQDVAMIARNGIDRVIELERENKRLTDFEHRITNALTESLNSVLRSLERAGRGYSFDVLRAKILLSERAHKHTRPKFARQPVPQREPRSAGLIDSFEEHESVLMKRTIITAPKPPKMPSINTVDEPAKNYGVDISTLARLIESGEW